MKRHTLVPQVAVALSMLAAAAIPALALTPPAMTIVSGGSSVTIDATGVVGCVGCTTTDSSVAAGVLSWSGVVGDFTITNASARTKPSLTSPAMDIGIGSVVAGSTGGSVTVSFTDTSFAGSGPVSMSTLTTLPIGGSVTYSSYVDGNNAAFGTATPVGTLTSTGGPQSLQGAPSFADTEFSMTQVEQINLAAGAILINDDGLLASPNPPLTLTCSVSSAQVGVPYSSSVSASGGLPGYTFLIVSGALPGGLNMNTSGLISGTPTVAGNFTYVAQVTDSVGHTALTSSCGINVVAGTPTFSLSCPTLTTGTQGQPYSSSLVAHGGKPSYHFSISGGLCNPSVDGLTLNTTTGVISGTPKNPGTYTFVAKVTDSSKPSQSASAACSLVISPPLGSPTLVSGDTATIGFWHNNNGQCLILGMNGGSSSKALATWLATNFPYLFGASTPYGSTSIYNLTGDTNVQVASLFMSLFSVSGQKYAAQILAGALAVYATDSDLSGSTAKTYGFNSSTTGTGAKTYNVGANGSKIGLSNNQSYTVMALLQQANLMVKNNTFSSNDFNTVFNGINMKGDIK